MTLKKTCNNVPSNNNPFCETIWSKTGGGFVTARVYVSSNTYDIYLQYP